MENEAIELFEQWHPDLDGHAYVGDGWAGSDTTYKVNRSRRTKIIAITAHVLEVEKMKIMQIGCDDFIRKPYREREIFDALPIHLGLQFVYEEKPVAELQEPEIELQLELFGMIPPDLIKKLHLSVIELNPERIVGLTNKKVNYDPVIGGALQKLVKRFDYDRLLKLLDEYAKNTEKTDKQK
jgi:CheY-like chemotaxis protein